MDVHTDHYAETESPQGILGIKGETMSPECGLRQAFQGDDT